MALADLILLCSGQFTVRQIVEKIYRKQGAVPFKWILSAMHSLHQGGFFENVDELTLSPQLGGMYVLQFTFFETDVCTVVCLRQVAGAERELADYPCARTEFAPERNARER